MSKESVVLTTVERIKAYIKNSHIEIGDKLPTERELSSILEVGRSSIREALRILASVGIIEIRPTKGSYVISLEDYNASSFKDWFHRSQPEIFHLIELRLAIEPTAAYLAAQRVTNEQIQRLEECHSEFVRYIMENNILKIVLGDESFHNLIFEAAGNPLLQDVHNSATKLLTEYRKKVFSIPKEAMKAVAQHDEILRNIKDRQPELAKEQMIAHLLKSKQGLLETVSIPGV